MSTQNALALELVWVIIGKFQVEVAAGRPETGVQAFIDAWVSQPKHNLPETFRKQFIGLAETLVAETVTTSSYPLEEELLRGINLSTLNLVGELSPSLIHLTMTRAAKLMSKAEVELIADVYHIDLANNPKRIAPAIEVSQKGYHERGNRRLPRSYLF